MTNAWQPAGTSDIAVDRSILIIEDNETLALGLRTSREVEGYKVECITDGNDALSWLGLNNPDLIVLDLMLPGLNGFEVLRRYRARGGAAAVLILSARDQEVDKVQGFRIGADDYVVKPIGVLEFLARVEAIIRRLAPAGRGSAGSADGAARTALHDGVRLSVVSHRVRWRHRFARDADAAGLALQPWRHVTHGGPARCASPEQARA